MSERLSLAATAPDGIRGGELVARGRYPHQGILRQFSERDDAAVAEAMELQREPLA